MSIIRDLKTSHTVKFLLLHAVICLGVTIFILSKNPAIHPPYLPPYLVGFTQTFTESFAASFLSFGQLVEGLFNNFSGAPAMALFSRSVPVPVVSSVLSLIGFVLAISGAKTYGKKTMYLVFLLASLCFILSACTYYLDGLNNAKALLGHLMTVPTVR